MSFLSNYLERLTERGNPQLAEAVRKTTDEIIPQYVSNFTFKDHVVSLLVGDVQSG